MAFSYVQQSNANNTASATTLAAPSVATTVGNHLFAHVRWETGDTPVSVSDSAGNSYVALTASKTTNGAHSQWFYCLNALGSAANVVTATWTAAQAYRSIRLMEFSGTSPVFEQLVSTQAAAGSTVMVSGSFNTAAAGLILVGVATYSSDTSASYSAGYTGLTSTFSYSKEAYRISTGALTGEAVTYTGTNSATTRTMDILTLTEGGGALTYSYTASGGIAFSGAAPQVRGAVKTPAGGILFAGTAPQARGRSITASGGITLSGAAGLVRGVARSAAGGLQLAGAATVSFFSAVQTRVVTPVGGFILSGATAVLRGMRKFAAGGITVGGQASVSAGSAASVAAFSQSTIMRATVTNRSVSARATSIAASGTMRASFSQSTIMRTAPINATADMSDAALTRTANLL
jgi:hypothetical protein